MEICKHNIGTGLRETERNEIEKRGKNVRTLSN